MNRERWYLLIGFEGFEWKGEFEGCERKRKMGDHDGPTMFGDGVKKGLETTMGQQKVNFGQKWKWLKCNNKYMNG